MKDFLRFKKMITPVIIEVIFWVGVVVMVFTGLAGIVGSLGYGGSGLGALSGLVTIIVGPIFIRIGCELMLLAFKMYESLRNIEAKMTADKEVK